MKKLKFNSTLEHKSPEYAPYQIEVEKVITLYGREFEKMRGCPINTSYLRAALERAVQYVQGHEDEDIEEDMEETDDMQLRME